MTTGRSLKLRVTPYRSSLALVAAALACSACAAPALPRVVSPSVLARAPASPTPATPAPSTPEATATPSQVAPSPTEVPADSPAWTAAEHQLLAGIRADVLASGCRPVREELPAGATAGVGCDIGSELVEGVGFYQFADLEALMAAYQARLAQYGVVLMPDDFRFPGPGEPFLDCWRGYASESFFYPDGSVAGGRNREGCFVNEYGFANLRMVWGRSLVYIGVLGNNGDIAALKAWAYYAADGSLPTFGGPGVWQPST